ncbi:probable sigma factor [[Clostridium] sordellii]|uniref:Sigma factor n=1 Tax=Paraclostridium sordellii TaxID=1505 RepID=A0ABM9RQB3_PARSO|nr:sigma-70 family RNA polymerase sigma factor [Paeniclostridium sordellii]CEJ74241.1 putative sigma factor [[Clostridium] sordellii] [Paeniclostridium sordellii]CEN69783.1 probable sigma factor [[Clostridium] sordellii] [Paeniclostridium sordellii]CEN73051.1 probable sigma factor [[Clostridium] sordellii] [Paeniclostridium sordellii]CEO25641.1 probable sigma factor [[Clostridium] sordellii] [Paeniclostridium sordellii]CEP75356.1 probable sigma factor [[Clostridium] sordellii] [Paeniclostridiu
MDKKELQNNCFRFTEKILYGYKDIEEFIKNTEKKLKDIKLDENTTTVGTINYNSIQVSHTFNISRVTERKALDKVEEETELKIELYRNKKLKKEIDQAINNLSPIYRDIIKYRYIDGLTWMEIIDIMSYEERQLRNKKKQAIRSIAIKLFGIKLFEEEEDTLFDLIKI